MKYLGGLLMLAFLVISCNQEEKQEQSYLFNELDSAVTGVDFMNLVEDTPEHSIINYIYFYNGAGVAVGDINNDGLKDLFFVSNEHENKLYLNKGNMEFEDISASANINGNSDWNTGVTMVDINADGYLDIYVCAVSGLLDFKGHNELYINNGDNTFSEESSSYGLDFKGYSTQSYFFDYDKDGDLDMYLVNHAVHTNLSHGKASLRNERAPLVGDVLFKNNDGSFIDVSEDANIYGGVNGYGLSATIADFDNDGWDDIYVCNDFHEDDYFYVNNHDGTFTETLGSKFNTISRFSMGSDAADINNDGYQDLITLDMLPWDEKVLKETEGDDAMFNMQVHLSNLGYKDQYSRNMLQISHKGQYFHEEALKNQIADTDWSWAPLFADFDNDGQQDLFISNGIPKRPNGLDFKKYVSSAFKGKSEAEGLNWLYNAIGEMPDGNVSNQIYKGINGDFSNKTGEWISDVPKISNASIYTDLDNDGDLDIVTNNFNQVASIYQNNTSETNSINVSLKYKDQNIEGLGTKVELYNDGERQLKQVFKSRGFMSSIDGSLHFGLDSSIKVDSLVITWPNNKIQTVLNPTINSTVQLVYDESNIKDGQGSTRQETAIFEKSNLIDFTHEEDRYNDFVEEKLIPYKVSSMGPAVAVGDVDNNGFEDIYIGGASGKSGQLFMNSGNDFKSVAISSFASDAAYEDNSATFFDADMDGDLDLYIGSGISEINAEALNYDRLYLNNNGDFVRATNAIPQNPMVTSTVNSYDYDQDGDMDLFVGIRSNPNSFGKMEASYILKNDGKGSFSKDPNFVLNGMIMDAEWKDIDNDGIKDLLVATEWDQPKVYLNKNASLDLINLPQELSGLWQSITVADADNDGDQDILLGNLGLNSKFNLYFDGPLQLYYSDFDENGVSETMIAYNRNGTYYPLNTKDELAAQMNIINKIYTSHAAYAGKSMVDAMKSGTLKKATKYEAATLTSGYLRNDNNEFNTFVPFDSSLQLGPINDFESFELGNNKQLLITGNTYRFNTYHGSYSSLKGYFWDVSNNTIVPASNKGLDPINEQIKDVVIVDMKDNRVLLVVANNDSVKSYQFDK